MANLAIKGHPTRGKEVIQLLEMLGGTNDYFKHDGKIESFYYHIGNDNHIYQCGLPSKMKYFTLEEFLEKYPYKVGDKVFYKYENTTYFIKKMFWKNGKVLYELSDEVYSDSCSLPDTLIFDVDVVKLQPNKEETMEESTNKVIFDGNAQSCDIMIEVTKKDIKEIKINIPEDYKVFRIDDDNKIVLTKKQLQFPKTFIEVLNFWHPDRQIEDDYQRCYKKDLIEKFQDLLYARDAYWKIAGEEMGLGKPWEPDWSDDLLKFYISFYSYEVDKDIIQYSNKILVFPTEKMRDEFYDNFKDLIESCKGLL